MPCRVGITIDIAARREYWRARVLGFKDWRVISSHSTKAAAQDAEDDYAKRYGCEAHAGGDGPALARWSVYRFSYECDKG